MTAQPQRATAPAPRPAFGTVLAPYMASATYHDGRWSKSELKPVGAIELSPAAHVLHYSSTCFEGFKARANSCYPSPTPHSSPTWCAP